MFIDKLNEEQKLKTLSELNFSRREEQTKNDDFRSISEPCIF